MSDDQDNKIALLAAELDRAAAELERARHAVGALQRLTIALKELVPRAFEEGFNRRMPDDVEPWLIDWLQSDAKRALEPLLRGGPVPTHAAHAAPSDDDTQ